MTYYTVNMDYSSNCSSEHNVFSSRRFTSRDEAREAMEFMQDMGFHKSVNSDVFANYTIVTYTRFGDVVNSASYDEEVYSEPVKCRRSLRLNGKKIKITVKPKTSRRSSSLRRSSRLRHNSLSNSSSSSSPPSPPSSETVSDTVNEINVSNGRHYEAYGKGYLLHPSGEDDPDYGEKYFHEGFWNVKQNAWFFRKQHLDTVKELCTHKTLHHNTKTAEVSIKNNAVSAEETLGNLIAQTADGLVQLREYKQGVLLTVPKTYFKYGNSYFYGDDKQGQWIKSANGWYFSRSMLPKLRESSFPWLRDLSGSWCARTKTDEITDLSQGRGKRYRLRARKTGRIFEHYGKGFILRPLNEDDPDWGEKYYRGGWWMPSQNGWFFKKKSDLEFTV